MSLQASCVDLDREFEQVLRVANATVALTLAVGGPSGATACAAAAAESLCTAVGWLGLQARSLCRRACAMCAGPPDEDSPAARPSLRRGVRRPASPPALFDATAATASGTWRARPQAIHSGAEVNRSAAARGLAESCSSITSCATCAVQWPTCAWCGSSGTCQPAPSSLVAKVKSVSSTLHVILSSEEYKKTFGSHDLTGVTGGVDSNGCYSWVVRKESCELMQDFCTPYSRTCMSCNRLNGCGYCHTDVPIGDREPSKNLCVPGSYSSEIKLSSGGNVCKRQEMAFSENPGGQWTFGNWNHFLDTRLWDPGCVERCQAWQVRRQSSGEVRVGSEQYSVGYDEGLNCQLFLWPQGWDSFDGDIILEVILRIDLLAHEDDAMTARGITFDSAKSVVALDSQPADLPSQAWTAETSEIGCLPKGSSSCVKTSFKMAVFRSPVLVSLKSVDRQLVPPVSSARVLWRMRSINDPPTVVTTTTTTTAPPVSPGITTVSSGYSEQQLVVWIGALTMAVLMLGSILIVIWRWWRPASWSAARNGGGPGGRRVQSTDIEALERDHPQSRSQAIQPSNRDEGEAAPVCSVCLAELVEGDMARELPCHHVFHTECIDNWLAGHVLCPLCRFELPVQGQVEVPQQSGHIARGVAVLRGQSWRGRGADASGTWVAEVSGTPAITGETESPPAVATVAVAVGRSVPVTGQPVAATIEPNGVAEPGAAVIGRGTAPACPSVAGLDT